ncbi:sugar phosphate isomerase/epimerase family protein [Streptomyces subrutilus]|uniref:Sugar phosphate isomerase/epimerase n=1 Tax=Streptomyces subrutilus TaxID=36818 RepID=A0A5P2UES6_9ACTN|nr:sugar phosphate isomerase/epimerase family protein [Streptomyces subrutilus]QEU77440.1 sugar phosphate isomerase/epimerase [Streptomyces subrutilus]WSJ33477.1 sugar phosphate isomerase/epimerase [Streptomyces subrutilus]GGZ47460.1 hypothetical protein GCM10010371_03470 [Streptomyces subrutilus]
MKYAFSTLGVPGRSVEHCAGLAAEHGYDGLELRAHPEESLHPASSATDRTAALRTLTRSGVSALGLAGYVRVAAEAADEQVLAEMRGLVRLAADLEAPYVRVFPGGGEVPAEAADARAVRRLRAVAPFAERHGVRVLLETHDSHRTGAAAARVLDGVARTGAGVLWDVLHTWLGGETPAATRRALGAHLGYLQVKDVASASDLIPIGLGDGVLPLAGAVGVAPLDGWLCWEYEKRWYPEATELAGQLARGREHLERLVAAGVVDRTRSEPAE